MSVSILVDPRLSLRFGFIDYTFCEWSLHVLFVFEF